MCGLKGVKHLLKNHMCGNAEEAGCGSTAPRAVCLQHDEEKEEKGEKGGERKECLGVECRGRWVWEQCASNMLKKGGKRESHQRCTGGGKGGG